MSKKKIAKLQHFRPKKDVIERAKEHGKKGRPNLEDIKEMAKDTIKDIDDFVPDKAKKEQGIKDAEKTIADVEKIKKGD